MRLLSSAFPDRGEIPSLYTCQGRDVSPPLAIEKVPEGAKSLALIVEDPDVPPSVREDRLWVHWIVFNIPPETTRLEAGAKPPGLEGKNTWGESRYGGPCPPDRQHRYFFKLYALKETLPLKRGSTKEELVRAMEGKIIASCELMGLYEKS